MKRIICFLCAGFVCLLLAAQTDKTYNRLVERAMNCIQKDSLAQAEALFREALKLDASNARNALVFSNLGTVLKRQGKTDEAIKAYDMALNITPYATSILLNRAALYLEKNMPDKAYSDYCNVIDLIPENAEARLFRAYISMQKRRYDEARIDYNAVLGKDMKNRTARLGLIMLDQKEGHYSAATDALNLMIEETPRDISLLKMRVNLELDQNLLAAALASVEEILTFAPRDAETHLLKGDICLKLKKKKEARKAYERAVDLGIPRIEVTEKLKACK